MQTIIPAQSGLNPNSVMMGVNIGTTMNTIPIHSMNIPSMKTIAMMTVNDTHFPPGKDRMNRATTSPDPALMKIPTNA